MTSSRRPTTRRPRRQLNRTAIVAEALRLVRAEGLAAVTMRRLAEELGTAPMSLYRHVEDRQALLIAMLDEVAQSVSRSVPPPVADPRSEITAVLTAIHDALRQDPWAVRLIVSQRLAGPSILPLLERLFAALGTAGLSPRDSMVAYGLLWQYTAGELLHTHPETTGNFAAEMTRAASPETYPALAAAMAAFAAGPPGDWFPENLQRLLDGLLHPRV
ncbi:TetR/AcrR family transcriptional regulator [Streptomyces litchfieldiae]|uniref:TetR/AcrR family transcriptional regulator n=1 Tax=Streptomyces litchfieldiae TaxID=3075543 RepID=A0ABU2MVN4_9ACTN|nr:TetR/AcrR family transcriptional regulator [Streptomyces sp. DSM 44938]MDT0345711.1 TetR/AcrR family transcriptional regulator [Streptomyces sp. DSM 44938]